MSDQFRDDSLLRLPELRSVVPLSRSAIYRLAAAGDFPRPVRIGQRASAWRWRDVREWLDSRKPAGDA